MPRTPCICAQRTKENPLLDQSPDDHDKKNRTPWPPLNVLRAGTFPRQRVQEQLSIKAPLDAMHVAQNLGTYAVAKERKW